MRCVRALPIFQLMPAVGSRKSPVATSLLVDFPERLSGRTPFPACMRAPHPSSCRRTTVRGPR